jgi:DNA-binding MarR family transcriptional regulator
MEQLVARADPAEDVDVGPMGSSLGFLLRMAQLQSFEQYFTDYKGIGLKPGEFSVLTLILNNPSVRQGVLARRLMIKRAHMTKLVRSLEERGYVERSIPDEDRRSVMLKLTGEGRSFMRRKWSLFMRYEQARRSPLSAEQEQQLIRLLQTFVGIDPSRDGVPISA